MSEHIDLASITQIVAIDGPAGAGKSTVARRVADAVGFSYLDTGAMYRAATWRALHAGVDVTDGAALAESTRQMRLEMREAGGVQQVFVDGMDVTQAIRTPEVTRAIYRLDQNREVRAHLVALQRAFGASRPTVAEGRDIGTVVFPFAKCKIFLVASLEERARRRTEELRAKGLPASIETVLEEIRERDEKAMTRAESPLRQADDAVRVDTTGLAVDAVVDVIAGIAKERL